MYMGGNAEDMCTCGVKLKHLYLWGKAEDICTCGVKLKTFVPVG